MDVLGEHYALKDKRVAQQLEEQKKAGALASRLTEVITLVERNRSRRRSRSMPLTYLPISPNIPLYFSSTTDNNSQNIKGAVNTPSLRNLALDSHHRGYERRRGQAVVRSEAKALPSAHRHTHAHTHAPSHHLLEPIPKPSRQRYRYNHLH